MARESFFRKQQPLAIERVAVEKLNAMLIVSEGSTRHPALTQGDEEAADLVLAQPVVAGREVGVLRVEAPGMAPVEVPLVTAGNAERLGALQRMIVAARHLILG